MLVRSLAVAMLLAVTACSGSSSPSGPTAAPAPSVAPSPTEASAQPAPTPVASPTPSPSATAAAPARCTSGHLRLSVRPADSGAGQSHQSVVLTNQGAAACTLRGYPGASFVDRAGKTLGSPAGESPGRLGRVLLGPGGTATAVLTYSNAGAFPDSSCRPVEADRLRIYPPGDRVPLLVPDPVLVCSVAGANQLHIGPLEG